MEKNMSRKLWNFQVKIEIAIPMETFSVWVQWAWGKNNQQQVNKINEKIDCKISFGVRLIKEIMWNVQKNWKLLTFDSPSSAAIGQKKNLNETWKKVLEFMASSEFWILRMILHKMKKLDNKMRAFLIFVLSVEHGRACKA